MGRRTGSGAVLGIWTAVLAVGLGLSAGLHAQEPFPAGVEGELYYCPRIDLLPPAQGGPLTITLDGVLDEEVWQRAQFQKWSNTAGDARDPNGPDADLDLSWAAVADDQYLYIAYRVVDDVRVINESTGCDVWMDDSVELYIDANADGPVCPGGASCYGTDDAQITIGADQIGITDPELLTFGGVAGKGSCDFGGPAPELAKGIVLELDSPDGFSGYQGEIAIALDTMGNGADGTPEWHIVPSHGTIIGWNIQVNDDDGGPNGTARDSKLIWSKQETVETSWQNPGAFGKLQFISPGKALVSIIRRMPADLHNGGSGPVSVTVTPTFGVGVVVINEKLPDGLVGSNPSAGGVLTGNTITWNLGKVDKEVVLTYTISAGQNAIDVRLPGDATVDGETVSIIGDTSYNGSPITTQGFIKIWNHLGPLSSGLAGGATCDPGPDLTVDWIANEDETVTEANVSPFPGMIIRPKYGGTGLLPGGGARAAGLKLPGGKTVQDQFPVWHGSVSPNDTIDHGSPQVNGFDADDHLTMSSVYVTNHTGSAIQTQMGLGSDDSIEVLLDDVMVGAVNSCRPFGNPGQEQDVLPVTLPAGESRLLVKVADGTGGSGFRLRFQDPADASLPGLLPPAITLSLESALHPPPGTVARALARDSFGLADTVDVSLAATARVASDLKITERLPDNTTAEAISDGGALNGSAIVWNLAGITQKTVSYRLRPLACASDLAYSFSSFQVGPVEALVTGPSTLSRVLEDQDLGVWSSVDLGPAGGSAQPLGDHAVMVHGVGAGIKQSKDEFRFVSVDASGDYEISARIDCMNDLGGGSGQGGVMVRDTMDQFSAFAFLSMTTQPPLGGGVGTLKGIMRRETSATRSIAAVTLTDKEVASLPIHLRLKRTVTKLSFQRSADGVSYTEIASKDIGSGTTQINLRSDSLVGLAVTGVGSATRLGFSEVSGPPFTSLPPNPPRNLIATPGDQKVDLAWSEPDAGPDFTGYRVLRAGTRIADLPSSQKSYGDTGLTNGTQYCYLVEATRGTSASVDSNQACTTPQAGGKVFRRGDVDGNGVVEITDPVKLLGYLFLGNGTPECLEAGDTDNNGTIDITDAVTNLGYQFLGQAAPAAPGPSVCGPDPTLPFLGCERTCQ